jgi:DinB superfamily
MDPALASCLSAFERLEEQRAAVLTRVTEWPHGSVTFRPEANAWSATEVLDHVVLAEAGTIADVEAALAQPHLVEDAERRGVHALHRALRSQKKYQVPDAAEMILPRAHVSLLEVIGRWEQTRQHLRSLLERLSPADAAGGVFHHPYAGWMTVQEVMEHLGDHLYHHEFQLERVRASWMVSQIK